MEPFSALCPTQRPVTRDFDVFFDLRLNQQLSKQSIHRWFETPSRSLWRHCNDLAYLTTVMVYDLAEKQLYMYALSNVSIMYTPDWLIIIYEYVKWWITGIAVDTIKQTNDVIIMIIIVTPMWQCNEFLRVFRGQAFWVRPFNCLLKSYSLIFTIWRWQWYDMRRVDVRNALDKYRLFIMTTLDALLDTYSHWTQKWNLPQGFAKHICI